jgi:hypothetical protein
MRLLTPATRAQFEGITKVGAAGFFNREWGYVEEASATGNQLLFKLHLPLDPRHVLPVEFKYAPRNSSVWTWSTPNQLKPTLSLNMAEAPKSGLVSLSIAGHLAFHDDMSLADAPY